MGPHQRSQCPCTIRDAPESTFKTGDSTRTGLTRKSPYFFLGDAGVILVKQMALLVTFKYLRGFVRSAVSKQNFIVSPAPHYRSAARHRMVHKNMVTRELLLADEQNLP